MYDDETGYEKGEIQRIKIVETEIFSVDERIKIISGIIAIMGKEDREYVRKISSGTFMPKEKNYKLNFVKIEIFLWHEST